MKPKSWPKKDPQIAGLVLVQNVIEPPENPLGFPLSLTCGEDTWMRLYKDESEALYVWRGWIITVVRSAESAEYWMARGEHPISPEPCKSFGVAARICHQGEHRRPADSGEVEG